LPISFKPVAGHQVPDWKSGDSLHCLIVVLEQLPTLLSNVTAYKLSFKPDETEWNGQHHSISRPQIYFVKIYQKSLPGLRLEPFGHKLMSMFCLTRCSKTDLTIPFLDLKSTWSRFAENQYRSRNSSCWAKNLFQSFVWRDRRKWTPPFDFSPPNLLGQDLPKIIVGAVARTGRSKTHFKNFLLT